MHKEFRFKYKNSFVKVGRRAWFLLLYSFAYFGIANSAIFFIPLRKNLFLFEFLPDWVRFSIWFTGGMAAAISALTSPKPSPRQIIGFVGLCIPVAIRAVSFGIGIISAIWDVEDRAALISNGIIGFVVYGTMLVTILIVASWPEPGPEDFLSVTERLANGNE